MAGQPSVERLLGIYEKYYFFEMERREKLSARFSILIAIYSVLLAGMTSSLSNLPAIPLEWRLATFYILLIVQGVMLSISLIYAIRFLLVETYAYVRHAKGIEEYVVELNAFNQALEPESATDMGHALDEFLCSQYCEAAANNFEENNVKYGNFTNALKFLIIAAVVGLMEAVPYFMLKSEARVHARNVEIINLSKR